MPTSSTHSCNVNKNLLCRQQVDIRLLWHKYFSSLLSVYTQTQSWTEQKEEECRHNGKNRVSRKGSVKTISSFFQPRSQYGTGTAGGIIAIQVYAPWHYDHRHRQSEWMWRHYARFLLYVVIIVRVRWSCWYNVFLERGVGIAGSKGYYRSEMRWCRHFLKARAPQMWMYAPLAFRDSIT